MAKTTKASISKNVSTKKSNEFDFSKISNLIENISKKDIISIEDFEKEKTFISTGIHVLDALLSKSILKGGIPNNKITIIAGPKQTGKSFISLNIARNAQKMGYNIVWIDTEYSIEKSDFDMYGIEFEGCPDMRRILTDYGFVGHPLRKDFPLTGHVQVRYDEKLEKVIYEPVSLEQEFRNFDFSSPWQGHEGQKLPGDEKATKL